MKIFRKSMILILAVMILAGLAQQASAQSLLGTILQGVGIKLPMLLGTTGACNNAVQGGPCTQKSTLVMLDPRTGALIRTIGPVGYTVNGLAWDRTTLKLYATTAPGDTTFHGLITINPLTGKGTPVNKSVVNFGLPLPAPPSLGSPIHSLAIDAFGHLVAWYDEFPDPNAPQGTPDPTDSYVRIDKRTGIAAEFEDTGINTGRNGLSFGEFNLLWNIDSPKTDLDNVTTQIAYVLNPFDGTLFGVQFLEPPTTAANGDFYPGTNLYYGLNHQKPANIRVQIVVVDVLAGTVTPLGPTVDSLHTLAFIP